MKKPVLVIMAAGMGSRYGCLLYTSTAGGRRYYGPPDRSIAKTGCGTGREGGYCGGNDGNTATDAGKGKDVYKRQFHILVCNVFKRVSHHMYNTTLLLRFWKCGRDCILDTGQDVYKRQDNVLLSHAARDLQSDEPHIHADQVLP